MESPVEPVLTPEAYRFVVDLVYQHSRIRLGDDKQALLANRLRHRLKDLSLSSYQKYCQLLDSVAGPEEIEHLVDLISTNHTKFFREPEHFSFLIKKSSSYAPPSPPSGWDPLKSLVGGLLLGGGTLYFGYRPRRGPAGLSIHLLEYFCLRYLETNARTGATWHLPNGVGRASRTRPSETLFSTRSRNPLGGLSNKVGAQRASSLPSYQSFSSRVSHPYAPTCNFLPKRHDLF